MNEFFFYKIFTLCELGLYRPNSIIHQNSFIHNTQLSLTRLGG